MPEMPALLFSVMVVLVADVVDGVMATIAFAVVLILTRRVFNEGQQVVDLLLGANG